MKYLIFILAAASVAAMAHAQQLQPAAPVAQATGGLGASPSVLQGSNFQLQP